MTDGIDAWVNQVHVGDAAETLADMPADSVHFAMTSPPYYNLRDYGEDGQLGLEDTLTEYIANLVEVFSEVQRVLRPDGSFWLNLGDAFNSGRGDHYGGLRSDLSKDEQGYTSRDGPADTYPEKCKLMVPHRVAMALVEDGWVLRNDCVWRKPNPMPNSVKDRLNTTFEFVFHFAPEPHYWYDLDAVRVPHADSTVEKVDPGDRIEYEEYDKDGQQVGFSGAHPAGKNPGDVFDVTTKPFGDAHFATFPPELVETPLQASCPPEVCVECGAPYEREVERLSGSDANVDGEVDDKGRPRHTAGLDEKDADDKKYRARMLGWEPTCDCDAEDTEPGIALDPFAGSGTTCMVAREHGRRFVGIDLSAEYVAMAQKRIGIPVDDPGQLRDDESQVGFDAFAHGGGSL